VLVGASATDIRLQAAVDVTGEARSVVGGAGVPHGFVTIDITGMKPPRTGHLRTHSVA
jgi:hypothetical protein